MQEWGFPENSVFSAVIPGDSPLRRGQQAAQGGGEPPPHVWNVGNVPVFWWSFNSSVWVPRYPVGTEHRELGAQRAVAGNPATGSPQSDDS